MVPRTDLVLITKPDPVNRLLQETIHVHPAMVEEMS